MKKYKYIQCKELDNYDNWEIVKIIDGDNIDMAVIMYEDKPIKKEVYLSEATTKEIFEELNKRLDKEIDNND